MIISQNGILIRLLIRDIGVIGRATQGVRLINLEAGDKVIDVARVVQNGEGDTGDDDESTNGEGMNGESPDADADTGPEAGRNGT